MYIDTLRKRLVSQIPGMAAAAVRRDIPYRDGGDRLMLRSVEPASREH